MRTADFWFDPSCPYTWLASRWMLEVTEVRPVEVRWHVMSLSVLNEGREEDPEGDEEGYLWAPVRLCTAVAERYGQQALGRLFTALGERSHERGEWGGFAPALTAAGLPQELAAVAESAEWDPALRASHARAVALVGDDVGTPVIQVTEEDGRQYAVFGPVVSPVPRGELAGRLWDGVRSLAGVPEFYELRRPAPADLGT